LKVSNYSILPKYFLFNDQKIDNIESVIARLKSNVGFVLRDKNLDAAMINNISRICLKNRIKIFLAHNLEINNKIKCQSPYLVKGFYFSDNILQNINKKILLQKMLQQHRNSKFSFIGCFHNILQLKKIAHYNRIKAIFIAPIFKTSSHPLQEPIGLLKLSKMINQNHKIKSLKSIKLYALGGINDQNIKKIIKFKQKNQSVKSIRFSGFGAIDFFK
jgi:thiamine monophosphate synthase